MKRRDRFLTLTIVAIGLAVLVGAGIASKDRVLEEWWIHKLKNGAEKERMAAAERLADMGSVRAIPVIAQLLQSHQGGMRRDLCDVLNRILLSRETYRELWLGETAPVLVGLLRDPEPQVVETALFALGRIGFRGTEETALPAVMKFANDQNYGWSIRYSALVALGAVESQSTAAASVLREIAEAVEENPLARYRARESLRKLQCEIKQP